MSFTTRNLDLNQHDEVKFQDQPASPNPVTEPADAPEPVTAAPPSPLEQTPDEASVETHPGIASDVPLEEDTDFRALQRLESEHERLESEHAAADAPDDGDAPIDPPPPPADNPVEVPSDIPLDVPTDVPVAEERPESARTQLLGIGFFLLTLLTVTAIVAAFATQSFADAAPAGKPSPNSAADHGRGFENAHPDQDSEVDRERAMHPQGQEARGARAHGRKSTSTWVNRQMMTHSHHEDHPNRSAAEAKRWQDKRMWRQPGTWPGAPSWSQARSHHWDAESTRWPQRGGYGGAFITQAEYAKHYTVEHDFRIGGEPEMSGGYANFKHEGDRFVIVDPFPGDWATDWHKTDDVFLEYDQGYYLHNRKHPGSPLAVMVLE